MLRLMTLVLHGCTLHARISQIHTLDPVLTGKTFVMLPNRGQRGSAEFNLYARDVAQALTAKGLVERTELKGTDYAVGLTYGIDKGRVVQTQRTVTKFDMGDEGLDDDIEDDTELTRTLTQIQNEKVYERTLTVTMADIAKSPNLSQDGGKGINVYEGSVRSEGSADTFLSVSKCMVEALFANFPGESGRTTKTTLSTDKCSR
jgi:hypothetical protein